MKWISVSDRLPDENTYVLIHLTKDNWIDRDDPKRVYYRVAKFMRGLPMAEREKLPADSQRKRTIRFADEHGNNTVPYRWDEFGPDAHFGQEVDYWMPLPELPHVNQLPKGYRLCKQEVSAIRILIKEGMKHAEIAKRFGVHRSTITRINTGARWG